MIMCYHDVCLAARWSAIRRQVWASREDLQEVLCSMLPKSEYAKANQPAVSSVPCTLL